VGNYACIKDHDDDDDALRSQDSQGSVPKITKITSKFPEVLDYTFLRHGIN